MAVYVALRKESVDRNADNAAQLDPVRVALRKESVDRNYWGDRSPDCDCVALRKESVDRNNKIHIIAQVAKRRSPQGERG